MLYKMLKLYYKVTGKVPGQALSEDFLIREIFDSNVLKRVGSTPKFSKDPIIISGAKYYIGIKDVGYDGSYRIVTAMDRDEEYYGSYLKCDILYYGSYLKCDILYSNYDIIVIALKELNKYLLNEVFPGNKYDEKLWNKISSK